MMTDAEFLRKCAEKDYLEDADRERLEKIADKKDICWCKDCEYGYIDGLADITCVNHDSEMCTEPMSEFESCENCVRRNENE